MKYKNELEDTNSLSIEIYTVNNLSLLFYLNTYNIFMVYNAKVYMIHIYLDEQI